MGIFYMVTSFLALIEPGYVALLYCIKSIQLYRTRMARIQQIKTD